MIETAKYRVSIEIPEQTVINGKSLVLHFETETMQSPQAYDIFNAARKVVYALNMEDVYVNLIYGDKIVSWYRRE